MNAGIPDKLYYKIGEVAAHVSLRPSVLRFWETEFALLKPVKSRSGQRLYTKQDLELVVEIKNLLYVEKLTIEGARKKLNRKKKQIEAEANGDVIPVDARALIEEVKTDLKSLRNSIK
jgi:DNA-binding transcriptional MerR regulator